jgi:hypothetical protein
MIDNTHVVQLRGSGREMAPVPEIVAFGERFGFELVAHAIGITGRRWTRSARWPISCR